MEIAVIGATGRTGRWVVEAGVRRGHVVRAVNRRPDALHPVSPAVHVAVADALDPEAIDMALTGTQAVISAIGVGTSRAGTELYSRGTANLLAAMARHGIARLVVISAAPVGPRHEQPLVQRRVVMPLLELAFGTTYVDMRRMESLLAASPVDWVALRPPRLVDAPATGAYRMQPTPPARGTKLTCADLALAALDVATGDVPSRQALYIAN